jgi:hypothetical protein
LKNVLLRGLFEELRSIDISGTAVKTLDLSAMAAKELDEVSALDCDKLCAILWPNKKNRKGYLRRLHMYTTMEGRSASGATSSGPSSRAPDEYDWYVSVSDARILRSLVVVLVLYRIQAGCHTYVEYVRCNSHTAGSAFLVSPAIATSPLLILV